MALLRSSIAPSRQICSEHPLVVGSLTAQGRCMQEPARFDSVSVVKMNVFDAQSILAEAIINAAETVETYWWRPLGDDTNSLNRFLGVSETELKSILQPCGLHLDNGKKFSKNNFEMLLLRCGPNVEHTTISLKGKFSREKFIKIGKGGEVKLPRDSYNKDGALEYPPIKDAHWKVLRNRSQRANMSLLLDAVKADNGPTTPRKSPTKSSPTKVDMSARGTMQRFIEDCLDEAVKNGRTKMSSRGLSRFNKLCAASLESEAKTMLEEAVEQLRKVTADDKSLEEEVATPDRIASAGTVAREITPTVLLPDINNVEEQTATDEVIDQLKEEALLQSLLRKHPVDKRVLELKHCNGRRFLVVSPPETTTVANFAEEANKHGWIDAMLPTQDRQQGVLTHLAKKVPDLCKKVGQRRKISVKTVGGSTIQTLAMARIGGLNDKRLKDVRSFLKNECGVNMQHSKAEARKVDKMAGTDRTKAATFGKCAHEWSNAKGEEKKEPEEIEHWHAPLMEEIAAEIDLHVAHKFEEEDTIKTIEPTDCVSPGFEKPGVVVCVGGDHGDKNCPINAKINLSSPHERKKKKLLNDQCPVVEFASVGCSKDTHDVLDETVMPSVKEDIRRLAASSTLAVCDLKCPTKTFRSCAVPPTVKVDSIGPLKDGETTVLSFACAKDNVDLHGTLRLNDDLSTLPSDRIGKRIVVSGFHELFIGDLAFLAMLIGVNNSDGKHCSLCQSKTNDFDCNHSDGVTRTRENLRECLEQCPLKVQRSRAKKPPPNYKGVNKDGLLDIDPQRIAVPILHCPMGSIDKVLESFKHWIDCEVERLPEEVEGYRTNWNLSKDLVVSSQTSHDAACALLKANPTSQEAKTLEDSCKRALAKAAKGKEKAKETLDEAIKRHNARKASLVQQMESVCGRFGIGREHCHGGKFNGANCMRIMEQAEPLFVGDDEEKGGFLEEILKLRREDRSEECARSNCKEHARMIGSLDATWSSIGGVDAGPLPTQQQIEETSKAMEEGKAQWSKMGLTTHQPKWHLTFDGHPLLQCTLHGGTADKADDAIEAFHQTLKKQRERCRGARSYKTKENCIRRELRRARCPSIKRVIDRFQKKRSQSAGTKRSLDAQAKQKEAKRVKTEKRKAFINNNNDNN